MTTTKLWGAPGTGKTTRLIHEIEQLQIQGYSKSDFVITTFRRQMADEIENRLGWDKKEGLVNTLHGICRSLAEINAVIEPKDKAEFCNTLKLPYTKPENGNGKYDQEPGTVYSNKLGNLFFDALSFLINNQFDFIRIYRYHDVHKLENAVPDPVAFMKYTAEKYTAWKAEHGLHDFDDMLTIVYNQKKIPTATVLAIDEFQDLTPLQYKIICMWAEHMEHVLIAGDPRQSIYAFWGADSKFFEEHEGEQTILPISYRLPTCIWNYAKRILEKANLTAPDIETTQKEGLLKRITIDAYYDRLKGFKENTFHLVRINEMGRTIAQSLASAGIPFSGISGWGAKQIHLYNCIVKIRKNLSGIETPITADELDSLIAAYPAKYFALKKVNMRKKLVGVNHPLHFENIHKIAAKDIYGKRGLWYQINSDAVLEGCLGGLGESYNLGRIKILAALKNHKELITTPTVTVATIHAAKGGERDYVFLHESITKKIYNKLYADFDYETQKAEAQVFYVGATRARQALFIVEGTDEYNYALPDAEVAA